MDIVNKLLVSVIVPVYKVEKYINKCVESIVNQTYDNIEIILVDDGSPDRCPEICDKWALKDSRIKVLHKENGGLSDARNAGLNIAKGEFIAFIDSDDYVHPQYIEIMYRIMIEHQADVVLCDYESVRENMSVNILPVDMSNVHCVEYNRTQAVKKLIGTEYDVKFVISCAKLYKKRIWTNLRFEKGKLHEDEFASTEVYLSADKSVEIDSKLYYYIDRSGSITNTVSIQNKMDAMEAIEFRKNKVCQMLPELRNDMWKYYIDYKIGFLLYSENAKLYNFLSDLKREILTNMHVNSTIKGKVRWCVFLISPCVYKKMMQGWLNIHKMRGKDDFNSSSNI